MALHPQCKAFLDILASGGGPPLNQLPLEQARAVPGLMVNFGSPEEPVVRIENRTVPGPDQPIAVRVYKPSLSDHLPAVMFFHGGGFVLCDLDSHDRECRSLANQSGCAVIAVDYRRAPEHRYPAAAEDAYAATRYVAEHASELGIDASRMAVCGDSAGGNLAAVVSLMARDRGGPSLRYQLLVYPLTDFTDDSPSLREYNGVFLSTEMMDWFADSYVPPADRRQPYASPLLASDLRGLPPAYVITAECDMVRDQGEAYARALQAAGVAVESRRYEGMIHPFFSLGGIVDSGREAITDAASKLRAALTSTVTV
jgi:acetyl esterase/lipase